MIIDRMVITRFRGFNDVEISLGRNITVIAGQNGTQKTTLLGVLTQPFTITNKDNPMYGEKPLCGGSYRSAFAEKFKLSQKFDKPKEHEWTLHIANVQEPFTVASMRRDETAPIRFWKKGDRSKGSGYIQMPVIFLSLSRLIPIGEDPDIDESRDITLSEEEQKFIQKWHTIILINRDALNRTAYVASKQKNTLGINTDHYDWKANSAGQDNLGKILLSVLSFRRLKEKAGNQYTGGILAIDEIDAALYPASQLKLLEALRKFSSEYKVQIIFTTHSLILLEKACELQASDVIANQVNVTFLEKQDKKIIAIPNIEYETIKHKLNVTLQEQVSRRTSLSAYTEDEEARIFLRALLKGRARYLKFYNVTFGCGNLLELARKKVPAFVYPNALIFIDGDIRSKPNRVAEIDRSKHMLILAGDKPPEVLLADYLHNLEDSSDIWNSIKNGYSWQICFRNYTIAAIKNNRVVAKEWFRDQYKHWGRGGARLINAWANSNQEIVDEFITRFIEKYNKIARQISIAEVQ